jgi:arylsulfatase A
MILVIRTLAVTEVVTMKLQILIDNFETGKQELYDLQNDISELIDISAEKPDKTNELYTLLKEWRISTGAKMMNQNPNWIKKE